ncbi:MAG: hypothetical protein DRJ06_07805, partial [Candidatus Aminicenantes bacterium]
PPLIKNPFLPSFPRFLGLVPRKHTFTLKNFLIFSIYLSPPSSFSLNYKCNFHAKISEKKNKFFRGEQGIFRVIFPFF